MIVSDELQGKVLFTFIFVLTLASIHPVENLDVYLNIRTGAVILDRGDVPHSDIFSLNKEGLPWIEHKWLFDLFAFGLHRLSPFCLPVARIVLLFFLLSFLVGRFFNLSFGLAALLLFFFYPALDDRLVFRAHLLGMLFFSAQLFVGEKVEQGRLKIFLLVLIQALWVNCHASFVIGLLYNLGYALRAIKIDKTAIVRSLLFIGATLVNPYGYLVYFPLFSHYQAETFRNKIMAEWQPLDFKDYHNLPFLLYLFIVVVLLIKRRRSLPLPLLLVGIALTVLALKSQRFVDAFLIATLPIFATIELRPLLRKMSGAGMIAIWLIVLGEKGMDRLETKGEEYLHVYHRPLEEVVDFLEQNSIGGRIFNSYDYGQYLAGRLYPESRIFIDGRIDLYSEEYFSGYMSAVSHWSRFNKLDNDFKFDLIVLRWPGQREVERFFLEAGKDRRWAMIYLNSEVVVFIRRDKMADLAERFGFSHVAATSYFHYYNNIPIGPLRREIEMALSRGNLGMLPGRLILAYLEPDRQSRLIAFKDIYTEFPNDYATVSMLMTALIESGHLGEASILAGRLKTIQSGN